jgi:hypothetical protein
LYLLIREDGIAYSINRDFHLVEFKVDVLIAGSKRILAGFLLP